MMAWVSFVRSRRSGVFRFFQIRTPCLVDVTPCLGKAAETSSGMKGWFALSLCIEGQSVTEGRIGKLGIISCLHYLHALMVYQAINAQARVALRLELLSEQCIPRVPSLAG